MKLKELFDRWEDDRRFIKLMEQPLIEMAITRSDADRALFSLQYQINMHLLKIILYPHYRSVIVWSKELQKWGEKLSSIRLKPKGKYIPYDLVWKRLYRDAYEGHYQKTIQMFIRRLKTEYPAVKMENISIDQIKNEIEQFLEVYCTYISTGEDDFAPVLKALINGSFK